MIAQERMTYAEIVKTADEATDKLEAFKLGFVEGLSVTTGFVERVQNGMFSKEEMPAEIKTKVAENPEQYIRSTVTLTCNTVYDLIGQELTQLLASMGAAPDPNVQVLDLENMTEEQLIAALSGLFGAKPEEPKTEEQKS